jgi:hypothetical protein
VKTSFFKFCFFKFSNLYRYSEGGINKAGGATTTWDEPLAPSPVGATVGGAVRVDSP